MIVNKKISPALSAKSYLLVFPDENFKSIAEINTATPFKMILINRNIDVLFKISFIDNQDKKPLIISPNPKEEGKMFVPQSVSCGKLYLAPERLRYKEVDIENIYLHASKL